jgi:ubiquinol-cytochrome c reductase cytochrome c1 subunit
VAMPHVLYEWQGDQRAVYKTVKRKSHVVINGNKIEKEIETEVFDRLELEKPGSMTAKEYDKAMLNLTHFLVYLGEPAKLVRYRIGIYVLIFLVVFLVFAYLLKKEYWKDIH